MFPAIRVRPTRPPSIIDWPTVQASGVIFAFAKATEGLTITDPDFVYNVTQAKAAGVVVGAYHFAHPELHLGTAGADASAAQFWNVAGSYIIADGMSLMPVLDYETPPGSNYTQATSSQWVNRWCQDIVNYGASHNVALKPIVYTYNPFATEWLDSTVTRWPVWIGNPNPDPPQTGAPDNDSPWSNWNFWQYDQNGTVPGIESNLDLDVFNGSTADLLNSEVVRARSTLLLSAKTTLILELSWVESQPMPGDPPPGPSPPFFGVQVGFPGSPVFPGGPVITWTNFSGFVRPFGSQYVARDVIGSSAVVLYELSSGVISQYIPAPTTLSASNITTATATLSASDIPVGSNTLYWFKYGTDTNYINGVTVTNSLATSTNPASLSVPINGLTPSTVYHFQVVVTDDWGTQYGGDQQFTTLGLPPTLVTLAASSITATTATLNGTVNGNGTGIAGYFQYDLGAGGTSYSYSTFNNQFFNSNDDYYATAEYSTGISNLSPNTTYHYRILAFNGASEGFGADTNFTTAAADEAPTAVTDGYTNLVLISGSTFGAQLTGTVDPNGTDTTVYFSYGTGPQQGALNFTTPPYDIGAGTSPTNYSYTVSNLNDAVSSVWYFSIIASNSFGVANEDILSINLPIQEH
jgi:GH25 family lysozyme M1 (1,4-beta-N-acetylmuramidase)